MTEKSAFPFGAMLPGFEFMQQLAASGSSGGAAPGLQHWIAPTVNIEELDRRIQELKTVQFWLEQNLLGVKSTVQALEVQKMTLQTLQGMNLSMGEIAKAFTLPTTTGSRDTDAPAPAPAAAASQDAKDDTPPKQDSAPKAGAGSAKAATEEAKGEKTPTMVDALQWWGALSQQFQQIAAQTLQESAQRATAPAAATKGKASGAKSDSSGKKTAPRKTAAKKAAGKKASAAGARSSTSGTTAARKKTATRKKKQ